MKNMRFSTYGGILMAGSLALGLQAQDASAWSAGGSLIGGVGRTSSAAGLKSGLNLWGGYGFKTDVGDVLLRPGLGLTLLMGSNVKGVPYNADYVAIGNQGSGWPEDPSLPGTAVKHELTGIQVLCDAIIPIFENKAKLILGLSLNSYSVKFSGGRAATFDGSGNVIDAGVYSPIDLDSAHYDVQEGSGLIRSGNPNGTKTVPGQKFGFRVGFEYTVTKNLGIQMMFQQTELGRMLSEAGQLQTIQPAWLELGVSYHF